MKSDSFGLYHLDGIRPGSYSVRVAAAGSQGPAATRAVTVTNDFLFDVDVTVDCPLGTLPPAGVAPAQNDR